MAARTQAEQADVDQCQADTGDQAGNDRIAGDQRWRLDAARANGIDDHDAEHQRTEGVHGQVTIDEPLGKRRRHVLRRSMADITGGQSERSDAERGQSDDLQRCEETPDGIQQAARIERNEEHHQEVHRAVEEQRQWAFAGQGCQADFERHGRGTRRGEQRADSQVAGRREQATGDLADRAAQGIHGAPHLGQGHDGDHGQADCSDQEAQRRHPDVRPGLQTDDRREDDVASPDEQGKRHKTKCQDVLAFQHFH
ncbi:hypothetical protein D3C76_969540 [compost metagenome]